MLVAIPGGSENMKLVIRARWRCCRCRAICL